MSLKIDRLQLEIVINNDQARKQLRFLEDEARQINKELKGLKEGTQEWIQKSDRLKSIKQQMDGIYEKIGLTGLSLKELGKRQKELNLIISQLDPNTKQYKELDEQLKAVKNRIVELRGKAIESRLSFSGLADGFNKYFGIMTAGIAAFSGVIFSMKEMVRGNAELSDSLSDVRKTTGLSQVEVKELYKDLGKLNTRTARKELMELAAVAGKLGYSSKEEILGFVKAADQINVALAKDLGGDVEQAINDIGKLTDIFKIKEQFGVEQAMLKTGSAINALGAASSANEGYIVEFAKRVGGIAPQADISIQNVMGLGATLDQLGQQNETSSTAIGQLLTKMFQKPSEYAKIAGLNVKDFSDLLNKDANAALIAFLNGLQKNKGGLQELATKFQDLGIDGTRAISVIGVLANNTELLANTQKLANEEFSKGTSLTNEFSVKNDNMAGNLEKIGKALRSYFVNSSLTSGLEKIVGTISRWFEIPLSQKMQEESIQVNALTSQLTDANTSMETRKKLYADLKAIAPSVLEGIDQEAIAYDKLRANLEKYNEQMVNRIIIQKQQEKVDEANQILADNREKRLLAESELRSGIMNSIQLYRKNGNQEQANKLEGIMNNETLSLKEKLSLIDKEIKGNNWKYEQLKRFWREEEEAQKAVNALLGEKNKLMKDLGIDTESNRVNNVTKPGALPSEPPAGASKDDLDRKAKEYQKYIKDIGEKLRETLILGINNEQERELKMLELDFKRKLESIKGHTKEEEALRVALQDEYNRKVNEVNDKYSEIRQKEYSKEVKESLDKEKAKWDAILKSQEEGSAEYLLAYKAMLNLQMEMEMQNQELSAQQILEVKQKYDQLLANADTNFSSPAKTNEDGNKPTSDSMYSRAGLDKDSAQGLGFSKKVQLLKMQRDIELSTAQESADGQKEIWSDYFNSFGGMISGALGEFVKYGSYARDILTNIFSTIDQYEEAQLKKDEYANETKKNNLKKRLDAGKMDQKSYDKEVLRLDNELKAKQHELQVKQAKRQRAISLVNAIIGAAQMAISGFSTTPFMPLGLIMGALALVLGGIQVGLIASTKIPEAAKGRYGAFSKIRQAFEGRYDVIGQQDGKLYKNVPYVSTFTGIPGKPMIVNETGDEIVIDPYRTKNMIMNYPHLVEAIMKVPGRSEGSYPASVNNPYLAPQSDTAISELNEHLSFMRKNGIQAFISYDAVKTSMDTVSSIEQNVKRS